MTKLYVSDTVGVIEYFSNVFDCRSKMTDAVRYIYDEAFLTYVGEVRLSIPSVVFVEIHEKWCLEEEFTSRFYYEVFSRVKESPNIEVKPIDRELIEILCTIGGSLARHEIHDKLILASAMMLNCTLITCDSSIIDFNEEHSVVPRIIY